MTTQLSAPRTAATAAPPVAPPRGLTRQPAVSDQPDTRYAGAVSLAAALAGILLGASGARGAGIAQ
ncbi:MULTISPECIES: hypothetical protein [unclassified Microbacterium]|uniref:hypothetical protein n=1 Tax=unclassified Microbacterium TaxID=2609290 RepID=UPI00214AD86D|nr:MULTISPECIES: hypothetical protein [unclassified Microbacterium]MCR2784170.1 hypothetical protein [Microbacterium sp. zg.B96]WIM14996.1 hypothetical protein QNO11_10585 [Microbacterium sp. zg-B96]